MRSIFLLRAFVPSWQTVFAAKLRKKIIVICNLSPLFGNKLKHFYPQDATHDCRRLTVNILRVKSKLQIKKYK